MSNKNFLPLIYSFTHKLINSFTARPIPFKAMFDRFRRVLDSHNRAIEIIADMGDKLGGDYIFDIVYLRTAYSGLYDSLKESLASFDELTENRYAQLKDVLSRIDRGVRLLVYDETAGSKEFVLPYNRITWSMAHEVGGKNANLAELANNTELNIPDAFAVTVFAYNEFLRHNGIEEKISALYDNDAHSKPALNEIHDSLLNGEIPPGLSSSIDGAIAGLAAKHGDRCFISVRSSAEAEDGEFSFAGQFETLLNVPLDSRAVQEAYRRVTASLFSYKASAYQQQLGIDIRKMKMAVGCMVMIDAAASGVIYSTDPGGAEDAMLVSSTLGLGVSVVEGRTDADHYMVRKGPNPAITGRRTGTKDSMFVPLEEGGITSIKTSLTEAENNSLTDEQVLELSRVAMRIESYYRQPQDIEWAIDKDGKIFILQARPLKIAKTAGPSQKGEKGVKSSMLTAPGTFLEQAVNIEDLTPFSPGKMHTHLLQYKGNVVQSGSGAGKVFIFNHVGGFEGFSRGDVLVARNDSSDFIRIMPEASAIITDTGSLTSHMASLCREFRVPAFVNAGNATQALKDGQEITVAIDEDTLTIYDGILRDIIEQAHTGRASVEDIYEFRKKRSIVRYIAPLNLVDPFVDNFTPGGCKTMHDILRFIHEKAITELVDNTRYDANLKDGIVVKLELPIPADITVMDIGGGLDITDIGSGKNIRKKKAVTVDQITSIPLKAVVKGMLYPGVWNSDPVAVTMNDIIAGMARMPELDAESMTRVFHNLAVASRDYVNLNMRFGYHFSILDCYCSENTRDSHLYFRFAGGGTDIFKRSRRLQLIAFILEKNLFNISTKGDILIARLANVIQDDMKEILDQLGRLLAYTRQLDALLRDDNDIDRFAQRFLEGNYDLT